MWSFEKNFRSNVMACSRTFGTNETQELLEGQLVSQELLQVLPTGVNGRRQRKYWDCIKRLLSESVIICTRHDHRDAHA